MQTEKIDYRLKGHETFFIREGWLTKALFAIKNNSLLFKEYNGADALGVGSNMAKSIRYWMKAAGLTKEVAKKGTFLTELGECILVHDPYFEQVFSLWMVHIELAKNKAMATSLALFFQQFTLEQFDKKQLCKEMRRILTAYTGKADLPEKSIEDDCQVILHMYLSHQKERMNPEDKLHSPFSVLGLLKKDGTKMKKSLPDLNHLPREVVFYLFADRLNEGSIEMEELLQGEEMPGKILNLNRVELNRFLDELEDRGEITVNRTAGLDMVYPKSRISSRKIRERYYGENDGE